MIKLLSKQLLILAFISFGFLSLEVHAQSAPPASASAADSAKDTILGATEKPPEAPLAPEVLILRKIEQDLKEKYKTDIYVPPSIPSLIYTQSQQSLLREARNGFNTRVPTDAELRNSQGVPDVSTADIQSTMMRGARSLSLGGIVFLSTDDWTIWLNKKRITSTKIPPEAIDLRVYKEFIEVRWYDSATNQIYPIRLRPNQTFNLDAHTFVPG